MKRRSLSKLMTLLLAGVMSVGMLAGCGSSSDTSDSAEETTDEAAGEAEDESEEAASEEAEESVEEAAEESVAVEWTDTIKIGVLVADVSGEEALGFREYYEGYISENYNVTMVYTDALSDASEEKSAIEKFAAQGCDAIISLSDSDRSIQLETCEEYGLYYAVASGMLDDDQYEEFKSSEYFVGQIGPSMDTEYEAGYAMAQYYVSEGAQTVAIYGAFIPNSMHVYRLAGMLDGLGVTYDGASGEEALVAAIFADQGLDTSKLSTDGVQIVAYFQGYGDTTTDELNAAIQAEPDAFLSVGMATTFFTQSLNTAGISFGDIDSFTSSNLDAMENGCLTYLAGKYSSSIGPIFAAVVNAVNGTPIRDEDGNAISISQSYLVATDVDTFNAYYAADQGDSPIFSTEVLNTLIGDVSYEDFAAAVTADRS